MKESRADKLNKFRAEAKELDRIKDMRKLATADFEYLPEREAFIDELSEKIKVLNGVLGNGLEITNIDGLVYELEQVSSLKPIVDELRKAISEMRIPKSLEVVGIDNLVSELRKDVKVEIDLSPIKDIPKQLAILSRKIVSLKVPSQKPDDYIPMRRVMKVGQTLMYDDSFYTGGGGGSSIPTKNGAVPVVNPDGSNIGGSGAVTNDGTFATPTKQDTGNASLSSIDTKLTSQATASNQTTAITSLSSIVTNTGNSATAANQNTLNTRVGDVTEASPVTDTASSGLNGRLQRIAQRLTSIIALLPGSLGQKARAASLAVTLSSEDITALTPTAAITNYAQETGGNLTTIAAKDFATQTTLALIKAKTDNIDVALSTRTKPSDAQHVIVDSGVTTGLTDTQLRATPVPISGTVTATTGGLTDTQLRATPVPVSGTVTATTGGLTDTQLRATAVPVSLATAPTTPVTGTFFQSTQPVSLATNTPTLQSGSTTAVTQPTGTNLHTVIDSGTITANPTTPTTLRYGQITVALTNTAIQLTAGAGTGFVIQALAANGGNVVIGDVGVTTVNGFQLQPGQSTGVAIDNTNRIYVNGTLGDGVCWIGS